MKLVCSRTFLSRVLCATTFHCRKLHSSRIASSRSVGKLNEIYRENRSECELDLQKRDETLQSKTQKRRKGGRHGLFAELKHEAESFRASDTEYYFENGFRKVRPYYHTFYTFVKKKWIGKTLREVYNNTFRYCTDAKLETLRQNGCFTLNLEPIRSLDTKLTTQHLLTSTLHLHEGAVIGSKIKILYEDSNFLVVDKPSSIPVHPIARYRFNSMIFILRKEYGYKDLFVCHRLDKATSGLLIIAKSKTAVQKFASDIRDRKVKKEYICKVIGEFPSDAEGIVCNEVVTVFDKKIGCSCAWKVDGFDSKEALTHFYRLSTDGQTSVLLCKPKTGRTHQIRVHLQYLGFPIVNDPMYNHEAWGEERFKHGPSTKNVVEVAMDISKTYHFDPHRALREKKSETDDLDEITNRSQTFQLGPMIHDQYLSETCEICRNPMPEPRREEMNMCLHAYRYKGPNWEFKSSIPDWANVDTIT